MVKQTPRCYRCGGTGRAPVLDSPIGERVPTMTRRCPVCRGTGNAEPW